MKRKILATLLMGMLSMQQCCYADKSDTSDTDTVSTEQSFFQNYAESVYADFSRYSGGKIKFKVETFSNGAAKPLGDATLSSFMGKLEYHISSQLSDNLIEEINFSAAATKSTTDLLKTLISFETEGLPLRLGNLRELLITAEIDGVSRQHRAVELCWQELQFCKIYDPAIESLESSVNSIRKSKAEAWVPNVSEINKGAKKALLSDDLYAEALYSDYSKLTNGQVKFSVAVLRNDAGANWQGTNLMALTGAPFVELKAQISSYRIGNAKFSNASSESKQLANYKLSELVPDGLSLEDATLRQLRVRTTVGLDTFEHDAAELCWSELDQCRLYDPSAPNLEADVRSLRAAFARGTPPIKQSESSPQAKATCKLLSGSGSTYISESAFTRTNDYGTVDIGSIVYGMSCTSTFIGGCHATGVTAIAKSSSATANTGYLTKCDFKSSAKYGSGLYSKSGRVVAGTGCAIGSRTPIFTFSISGTYLNTVILLEENAAEAFNKVQATYSCISG